MPSLTSSRPSAGSAVRSGGSVRAPPHLLHADARFIQSRFCSWPKAGLIDLAYESLQLAMDTFAAAKKPGLKEQEVQKPPASTETDVGEGDDTTSDESGADDDDGAAASLAGTGDGVGLAPIGIIAAGDPAFADPMDLNSHGTHVAGIIAANGDVKGVNPHARIVGVRVTLSDSGSSTGESVYTSGIVRGLGWMVEAKRDYGVNIEGFNLSIAGPTGVTYAARAAFKLAEENGIVGFVAAGNFATNVDEGDNLLSAVQQGSTVVVDSADTTGDTSWFSNYGKINTDVFSPGSSILATLPNDLSVYHPAIAKRYGEALVYEGFETAGSAGDAYDGDVGGGLNLRYFDEQAEDGCGEEIAATGERFFVGESSLLVVADEYYEGQQQFDYERRAAIVSEPIDLPATDSDTPYSAQVAASNGDAALPGLPGILDTGEATNSDVWKVVEGAQEAVPTHVVLQAGGSTELVSVIAGDMLYVWGVSRAIDERTFFRCLPLSALGMKAEGTVSEEDVPPSTVDEEEPLPLPGDPSALASTGDGAGCPLVVAAVLALVSACAVGTALRRARTSSSDRLPRSPER